MTSPVSPRPQGGRRCGVLAPDDLRLVVHPAAEWVDSRYVRELEAAGLTR